MTPYEIDLLGTRVDTVFYAIGAVLLTIEFVKALIGGSLGRRRLFDAFASVSTQVPSILVETFVFAFVYAAYTYLSDRFIGWTFPINAWTIAATLLAADFVYYWEHRFAHRIRLLWTQHAVHHSSRFMNVAVAIRFGPFEGITSTFGFLLLVLIGFPPALAVFGAVAVLAYQIWLHTETIGRLGPLEAFLNTPSNHRVHHGCDEKYLDKNYGGILMIWDRLFGTYQREEETPRYGLARDFSSANPVLVWFSEIPALCRDLATARSAGDVWTFLFASPDRSNELADRRCLDRTRAEPSA